MLDLEGITVLYGTHRALSNVSLSVDRGEIVGVVGPNGAGKTTLFKVLARIIEQHEGTVRFDKKPLVELSSSEIGYLAEAPFQFDYFTPIEMLLFERTLRKLDIPADEAFDILCALGMESYLHKPIKKLSQGLKKRVAVAAAFLGNPSIVILDEPLNSLDIQSVIVLKRLIQDARSRGAIVLISSHVLDFFDGLTTRVVFLNKGSVFFTLSDDPRKSEELYTELFLSE
jgi:ABC-2 type transport system ATP-binding protein